MLYASKPFLDKRELTFIYCGGGTPSYLSQAQIEHIFRLLCDNFSCSHLKEVTFECEPGTLTNAKLKTLKEVGVTRLSIGVESFNEHVLVINGRAHRLKEIEKCYELAKQCDFDQINIDLIVGMLGDTEKSYFESLQKAIAFLPDSITLYQLEIPGNTTIAKNISTYELDLPNWKSKAQWLKNTYEILLKAGYQQSSAYTFTRGTDQFPFVYRDSFWSGSDLIAIGASAFGYLDGINYQNQSHTPDYKKIICENKLPISRALPLNETQQFLREFILQCKRGKIDFHYFKKKYNKDVPTYFQAEIQALSEANLLKINPSTFEFELHALAHMDNILFNCFM